MQNVSSVLSDLKRHLNKTLIKIKINDYKNESYEWLYSREKYKQFKVQFNDKVVQF